MVSKRITPAQVDKAIPGITLVKDPVSDFSFARRANDGIARAHPDDVVLVGDDVEVVTHNAFDLMADEAPFRVLSASIDGRVGPWWQRVRSAVDCPREAVPIAEVPFVSFVCVYLPRPLLDMIGPLEPGFPGYGYEDTDYCLRVRRAGFSCGVSGVVVEHGIKVKSNFVEDHAVELSDMEQAARDAFIAKWSKPR